MNGSSVYFIFTSTDNVGYYKDLTVLVHFSKAARMSLNFQCLLSINLLKATLYRNYSLDAGERALDAMIHHE